MQANQRARLFMRRARKRIEKVNRTFLKERGGLRRLSAVMKDKVFCRRGGSLCPPEGGGGMETSIGYPENWKSVITLKHFQNPTFSRAGT